MARPRQSDFGGKCRWLRRVVAPFTALRQALERIWERIKANQEAAAEASGSRLGENTLLPVLSELLVACFISIFSFSLLLFLI